MRKKKTINSLKPPEIYRDIKIPQFVGNSTIPEKEIKRAVSATFAENQLTEGRVNEIFYWCVAAKNSRANTISVESWSQNVKLLKSRLVGYEFDIRQMLKYLPDSFQTGGYSLKHADKDRFNRFWTESYETIEKLFIMGIALGFAKHVFPKPQWKDLPDKMPYYLVTT